MPADSPPKNVRPQPRYTELPAGSFLWRVTKQPSPAAGGPVSPFRSLPADLADYDPRLGGRFDPTPECPYLYCYAAYDDVTAICEVLMRDVGFEGPQRFLLKRDITGRRLVILETRKPLWLVTLQDAADLAAAGQDCWLVHAESTSYRLTRQWAHWLRESEAPDGNGPAGLVWQSKRALGGRATLLFGDRCQDSVVCSSFGERQLDGDGLDWLNLRLSQLRTQVRR
jgi:hypothetical protein